MKVMLTGFAAIILIAVCAFFILDNLGFDAAASQAGPSVRLD